MLTIPQVLDRLANQYYLKEHMVELLKSRKDLFIIVNNAGMNPYRSKNYNNFNDFKDGIFRLEKGYHYLIHVQKVSILIYKKMW